MAQFGWNALLQIFSHFFFIIVSFWALQSLKIEHLIRKDQVTRARLLYVLLAVAIGLNVSNFFLDIVVQTKNIPFIFST